jgi:hypothetical protein
MLPAQEKGNSTSIQETLMFRLNVTAMQDGVESSSAPHMGFTSHFMELPSYGLRVDSTRLQHPRATPNIWHWVWRHAKCYG